MTPTEVKAVLGREVRAAMRKAGWGVPQAAQELGVTERTVKRWRTGAIKVSDLSDVAEKTGQPITLAFGPETTKEAPPWAGAVAGLVADKVVEKLSLEEAVERALRAALSEDDEQGDDDGPPAPASPGSAHA